MGEMVDSFAASYGPRGEGRKSSLIITIDDLMGTFDSLYPLLSAYARDRRLRALQVYPRPRLCHTDLMGM